MLSSTVGIAAAVIVGEVIRHRSISYGLALGIVGASAIINAVLWGGLALWERSKG
jgi:hypothetical protein